MFNILNLFNKEVLEEPTDSAGYYNYNTEGTAGYPLDEIDYEQFHADIAIIETAIKEWILADLQNAPKLDVPIDRSVAANFANLNIKVIAYPETLEFLNEISSANGNDYVRRSYGRWLDAVQYLSLLCLSNTLETLRARFLDSLMYGLDHQSNVQSKDDCLQAVVAYPWIPLLPIYQHLYGTDADIAALISNN